MAQASVVITGARGMLGSALMALAPTEYRAIGVDIEDGDLTKAHEARHAIHQYDPLAVVHCAAYTDVDGCTRDPETAFRVNANGTANVAVACQECDCYLIVISTDYVFDGAKGAPYDEADPPAPLNPYGESKLAGEQFAAEAHGKVLIARTQWLYGPNGRNFVHTIVSRGRETGRLRVVGDEYGSPTYTRDLAGRLWDLVRLQPTGIIHCANSGVCSWADLAEEALRACGLQVALPPDAGAPDAEDSGARTAGQVALERISWQAWQSPTRRPHYSPLASRRAQELGLAPLRPWQEAVREFAQAHLR